MADRLSRRAALMLGVAGSLALPGVARAEPGVSADRITFGQSAAFAGPAAALGLGMRQGILAAFAEANVAGGVNGRRLELVSYDDGYEPERAIANSRRLIDQDRVFALLGEVGTPTSKAALPIATEAHVPFVGPFSGAPFLRDPALDNVVNVRASYDQETEAWVAHLTGDLGISRVALLYQDDSFGLAGRSGLVKALDKRSMRPGRRGHLHAQHDRGEDRPPGDPQRQAAGRGHGRHLRGVRRVRQAGAPDRARRGLRQPLLRRQRRPRQGAREGRRGGRDHAGRAVPRGHHIPLVAGYQRAVRSADPRAELGFVSLEGYMVGRLVAQALARTGEPPTRAGLLATIKEVGTFDLGGFTLSYGPGDNRGSDRVFLTVIRADGSITPVARLGA